MFWRVIDRFDGNDEKPQLLLERLFVDFERMPGNTPCQRLERFANFPILIVNMVSPDDIPNDGCGFFITEQVGGRGHSSQSKIL